MSEIESLKSTLLPSNTKFHLSTTGKIMVGLTGGIATGLTLLCTPFLSLAPRKHCFPYISATNQQLANILTALKGKKDTLLDIGSVKVGRMVVAMAKNNFEAHSSELNPCLVLYSKVDALIQELRKQTKFFRQYLWKYNVAKYDNIVIFGVDQMMADLEKKFLQVCKSDCSVLACRFPLPNLTLTKTIGHGIDYVWVYQMKAF